MAKDNSPLKTMKTPKLKKSSKAFGLMMKQKLPWCADTQSTPVYFKVLKDTLYTYGKDITRYQIDKQSEYSFWFHSLADNIVKLHKSEDPNDTLVFSRKSAEVIPTYTEVTKKDSVRWCPLQSLRIH